MNGGMRHGVRALAALAALAVVVTMAAVAVGDGMIVPTDPDLRVRGSWAVKYHHVAINVRDQVAFVNIDQEFINTGTGMIEVEYFFPVPPEAAIDSMTLVVNGQEYAAQLLQADEARKIYEDIVRRKKDPALLEYAGHGLYRTRAFPLEPGKPARVVVTYKNVCRKDQDVTEVWYPLNTEKFSARPIEDVSVTVDIKSDADLLNVYSPTHALATERKGARHVIATWGEKNVLPVADFQLFYKTSDREVGAALLTYQPYAEKDGYFLLLVSPNPGEAPAAAMPKDVVLVLDRSGSMGGEMIGQARKALEHVVTNLNENDRFNVIVYNHHVEAFFDGLAAPTKENVERAIDTADRLDASGGTNIHEALLTAMGMCPAAEGRGDARLRPTYILFMTDGKPTVGKTDEKAILEAVRTANGCGARVFALGVGYDVNVRLLDTLVREHGGRSEYVKPKEPIDEKIAGLYRKIRHPVMTNLTASVEGLKLRETYPTELGDLFEGDQIVLAGRYDARDAAALPRDGEQGRATLLIKGIYQGGERAFEYPVTLNPAGKDLRWEFVEKLWAVRRVGYLLDQIQLHGESQELVDELVRLSREYGIITPYTSFLADESTPLAGAAMRVRAGEMARELSGTYDKYEGQNAAVSRGKLNDAESAPVASAPVAPADEGVAGLGGGGGAPAGRVVIYGNTSQDAYEQGRIEVAKNVRQVGNETLYQRGQVWIASNAADVDPAKDQQKIQVIDRFSEQYFELVRQNTAMENRILATQREGEELLVRLQGQVYQIR